MLLRVLPHESIMRHETPVPATTTPRSETGTLAYMHFLSFVLVSLTAALHRKSIVAAVIAALVSGSSPLAADDRQLRIINGYDATQPWPWMVSIGSVYQRPAMGHFCGGVLVAPQYVLTAGHCVIESAQNPSSMVAVVGRPNLNASEGEVIPITGTIVHPRFNLFTLKNDLALVRLAFPAATRPILPLTSAEESYYLPAPDARVLGWGVVSASLQYRTSSLQEASIPTIPDERCAADLGRDFDPATMLCAGLRASGPGRADGVDTCTGDSGGPLIVHTSHGWRVAGITSWGKGCATSDSWGVYARVSPHAQWIMTARTIAPIAETPPRITGVARKGKRITCGGESFAGDPADRIVVQFRDTRTGTTLGRKRNYRIRPSDIGRKIRCRVTAVNSGGRASLSSAAVSVLSQSRRRPNARPSSSARVRDSAR